MNVSITSQFKHQSMASYHPLSSLLTNQTKQNKKPSSCVPWFTWKAELLSTSRNTIRSKECQFSICVYKYTCSCMLMAYGASKVWSLKCGMRVYIMYFVCMLMNTHKMRTQSFIVYAPSVKNRIHNTHTFIQNTRAHTCIHQRHNAFRCKNIRSLFIV